MNPHGESAIVTGGASGLGAETARHLARAGAKVAVFDLNTEDAKKMAAEIGGLAVACDVSKAGSAEQGIRAARDAHGPARILVNCAGIVGPKRILGKDGPMPLDHFAKVIGVNLIGSFNMLRLAAADMSALDPLEDGGDGERGVIISTASVAAYEGQVGQAAYSASKGGIAALQMPAARELAQFGIRCCAIAPGIMLTPMMSSLPQDVQDGLAASVPFPRRFGKPSEYASLVLHIIQNVLLNGEVIRLDGALRMPPR